MSAHKSRPSLRLIHGDLDLRLEIGGVGVQVVPLQGAAPELDAVVVEEDTYRVLSTEAQLREPEESLEEMLHAAASFRPAAPGEVLVREGRPLELLAIVHDLEREPSWNEAWIAEALGRVFELSTRRHLQRLAMPMLGTVHGHLPPARFVDLLCTCLESRQPAYPRRLWLACERAAMGQVLDILKARGYPPAHGN